MGKRTFVQVATAYETLSDPRKRAEYDLSLRSGGAAATRPSSHFDPFDIFREFFGGKNPFDDPFFKEPFGHVQHRGGAHSMCMLAMQVACILHLQAAAMSGRA